MRHDSTTGGGTGQAAMMLAVPETLTGYDLAAARCRYLALYRHGPAGLDCYDAAAEYFPPAHALALAGRWAPRRQAVAP